MPSAKKSAPAKKAPARSSTKAKPAAAVPAKPAKAAKPTKYVYTWGAGKADGDGS
jgi:pyruvate, orthophosphate dikinase